MAGTGRRRRAPPWLYDAQLARRTTWYDLKRKFASGEEGATVIEYGLIAAGIAVAIIAAVFAIGDELNNFFTAVQTKLGNACS